MAKTGAPAELAADEVLEQWGPATEEVVVELAPPIVLPASPPEPKVATFKQLRKLKKPRNETVTVTLDQDSTPTIVLMRFQAIGSKRWEALLAEHPPTEQQEVAHRAEQEKVGIPLLQRGRLQWNLDTFPAAIIAACAVDPKLTDAQAAQLWKSDSWNAGELDAIFSAAVRVNTTAAAVQIRGPAGSLDEILARIQAS